ncbi:hypothetical protein [uncultured Stenotrophomonas sp.]|uniref:hypothetical protein n=1 Tax=uncultured Stenotrophomonas sp. TaxID=165438 RepID=UPI0025DF90BA|nr:hypothetical protein [uncultured Stenotrophomonas sp.]
MNTPDMLTPEERELARLLGRPGAGTATPSKQLDARIMDLARAKPQTQPEPQPEQTQADTRTRQRPTASASLASASQRRGWGRRRGLVSSLAVAASLVLVVGLAWQLRPLTPPQPAMQHAEMSAPAAAPMTTDIAAAEVAAAPAAPTQVAEDAAAAAVPQARSIVNAKASSAGAAQPDAAHKDKASAIEQPATSNAGQSPRTFSAAPVIVPPAPPAPPAPMMAPAPMAAPVRAEQADSADAGQDGFYLSETAPAPARAAPPRLTSTGSTPIPHAGAKTVSKAAEARRQRAEAIAADSTPDIEADATLSRHQWIKRIRERHEAGDLDGAKASLRRFAHDYPEARIPRDLRPLLKD